MTSFLPQTKKTSEQSELCSDVVREAGVEPARPCAPRRSKRCIVCSDFFYKKSERTHFIAPPFQITTAALGCDLASPLCGVFLILQKYRL